MKEEDVPRVCFMERQGKMAQGIGAWNNVLEVMTWAGMLASVAIPIANMSSEVPLSRNGKIVLFCAIEHVLICLKLFVGAVIQEEPSAVTLTRERREYARHKFHVSK